MRSRRHYLRRETTAGFALHLKSALGDAYSLTMTFDASRARWDERSDPRLDTSSKAAEALALVKRVVPDATLDATRGGEGFELPRPRVGRRNFAALDARVVVGDANGVDASNDGDGVRRARVRRVDDDARGNISAPRRGRSPSAASGDVATTIRRACGEWRTRSQARWNFAGRRDARTFRAGRHGRRRPPPSATVRRSARRDVRRVREAPPALPEEIGVRDFSVVLRKRVVIARRDRKGLFYNIAFRSSSTRW